MANIIQAIAAHPWATLALAAYLLACIAAIGACAVAVARELSPYLDESE
jgi:hypothetical protein